MTESRTLPNVWGLDWCPVTEWREQRWSRPFLVGGCMVMPVNGTSGHFRGRYRVVPLSENQAIGEEFIGQGSPFEARLKVLGKL